MDQKIFKDEVSRLQGGDYRNVPEGVVVSQSHVRSQIVPRRKLLREMRCPRCRRLLAKEHIVEGTVQIVCPKCKTKVETSPR